MTRYDLIRTMQMAYIEGTKEHGRLCETKDCCTVGMQKALDVAESDIRQRILEEALREPTKEEIEKADDETDDYREMPAVVIANRRRVLMALDPAVEAVLNEMATVISGQDGAQIAERIVAAVRRVDGK